MRADHAIHARAAITLVALGLLAGCSDAKAPNDANFRKALEPVVKDAFCRTLDVDLVVSTGKDEGAAIPIMVSPEPPGTFGAGGERASIALLDELAGKGLLVRTQTEAMAKRRGSSEQPVRRTVVTYAPTSKGEPYIRPVERRTSTARGTFPAICAAKGEIVDIVRWSDPAELLGRTMTQVAYSYRGSDPIDGAPQDLRAALERPKERTAMLVLNNDGWGVPQR